MIGLTRCRHYLLANSGLNAEHTARAIESIELQDEAEAAASTEFDVAAFVRQARERNIIELLAERRAQADRDFAAFMDRHMEESWEQMKRQLIEDFERQKRGGAAAGLDGARITLDQSTFGQPAVKQRSPAALDFEDVDLQNQLATDGSISWRQQEHSLAQVIANLNECRQNRQPIAICAHTRQVVASFGSDIRTQQLTDSWLLLSYIIDEQHSELGKGEKGSTLLPRRFLKDYMSTTTGRPDALMQARIATGARRYLENQFYELVEREVSRNPQEARMGGVPSIESKIRAYVNIRFSKNGEWIQPNIELVNNTPVWSILFYLVRAGFVQEAAAFTAKNENYFSKIEKNWPSYIRSYVQNDRRLPRQLAERMYTEYNQRIKHVNQGGDPFKHALYKIIGRFELARRSLPDVLPVVEDWMWLQLALVREPAADDPAYDAFALSDLQAALVKYGPRHFNPRGSNPLLYFQILLMSGQFERAVHYLASHGLVDAVHFAAVLVYFALLRITTVEEQDGSLLFDERRSTINFAGLVRLYAGAIQRQSPVAAVDYLCLICLNNDVPALADAQRRAAHDAIRDLVLSTRDFATLLGDVQPDGSRKPGYIERRMKLLDLSDERDYLYTITRHAAQLADAEGRVADAILLFHLAEDYDTVVGVVNKTFGEALLDPSYTPQAELGGNLSISGDEDPALLAKNMLSLYSANASIFAHVSTRNKETCETLLRIVDARRQHEAGQLEPCLRTIEALEIVPLQEEMSVAAIKRRAQEFGHLDPVVARAVPSLLLTAINCLKTLHAACKNGAFQDPSRQAKMAGIKKRSKSMVTYAGMIRLHMDASTYSALIDVHW